MPASPRHGGRHRKPRGAKHARRSASGTRRLGAAAGAALVGASLVTASPAAAAATPTPHALRVASEQVRLAAAANLLNVPINMVTDLVNIPYNEVQAVDFLSKSLYFSGAWFVVSSTNLWGVDPGDPGHFRSTFNLAIPIPALSGMNMDQDDNNGIGQQVWKAVAVMLPVSTSCDAQACTPNVPTSPITGVTSVDSLLWMGAMLTGMLQLPLTSSWFQPGPIMDMLTDGYTFGPEYEGYADPSGPVTGMFGTPGTEVGPNGEYLMPWHDETFKLDLTQPLQNYFNHLMADPSENPILLPSFEQIGRAVQNFYASSVVAFDPITAGSPFCPGTCDWLPPALDYPGLAQSISDLWPGNETLETWLDAHAAGTDNAPTAEQIARSIEILQQKGFFDFQNPSPPPEWARTFNLSSLAPAFHKMWTDFGFDVPDLNTTVTDGSEDDPKANTSTTQLKAAASEQTPEVPVTPTADAATPPAQSGGLTPPTDLNLPLPHWKNWKRPLEPDTTPTETGSTTGTGTAGTGSTGSHPYTPPKLSNKPFSVGGILKRLTGEKKGGATAGTGTGASDSAASSGDASSKAGGTE